MDRKTLDEALAAGRLASPGIELDAEVFGAHLSRVVGDGPERAWLQHAADLYLACAYTVRSAGVREALEQRYRPALLAVIEQVGGQPAFAEAVFEALHEKLLGPATPLARYQGRHPLIGWLSMLAARVAMNTLRLNARRSDPANLPN